MIKDIRKFLRAVIGNKRVDPALVAERVKLCIDCDRLAYRSGNLVCSICGCRVRVLAQYVENLPEWGCKHPGRASGAGWLNEDFQDQGPQTTTDRHLEERAFRRAGQSPSTHSVNPTS